MAQDRTTPQSIFVMVHSCFEHLEVWLNIDWGHRINDWTVKFIISDCGVYKVPTPLVLVESKGSWLDAGTCLVFVC